MTTLDVTAVYGWQVGRTLVKQTITKQTISSILYLFGRIVRIPTSNIGNAQVPTVLIILKVSTLGILHGSWGFIISFLLLVITVVIYINNVSLFRFQVRLCCFRMTSSMWWTSWTLNIWKLFPRTTWSRFNRTRMILLVGLGSTALVDRRQNSIHRLISIAQLWSSLAAAFESSTITVLPRLRRQHDLLLVVKYIKS